MGKVPAGKQNTRPSKPGSTKANKLSKEVKQASIKARQRTSSNRARDSRQREELDNILPQLDYMQSSTNPVSLLAHA